MLTKELSTLPAVQPSFIEPTQVSAVRQLPDSGAWTYEAKLDSYRCLAARRSNGVVLWSRRGTNFTARFPAIAPACEKLPTDTLIDGEVIVWTIPGKSLSNGLQHRRLNGAYSILCLRRARSPRSKRAELAPGITARATHNVQRVRTMPPTVRVFLTL